MTQLAIYMLWTPNLCPHPNMIKKMKTFLEVENKMGPIIPAPSNQYRLPLPEMNPNVRKGSATEKRRTVTPRRRFKPATPKATAKCLPLPQAPPKPNSNAATASVPTMVRQDIAWPGIGKMSDNLFQDRNWLLPKDYFGCRGRKGRNSKALPKRRRQNGRTRFQRRKVWLGAQLPSMQGTKERSQSSPSTGTNGKPTATETLTQTASDKARHSEYDQNTTAMGTGDRETE